MTWGVYNVFDKFRLPEEHAPPEDDLREHKLTPRCWCKPVIDVEESRLHLHNSLDGREKYESGELLYN